MKKSEIHLQNQPNNRYLHIFFKMNIAPALMNLKLFPNLKEVTESIGAFNAIQENIIGKVSRSDESVDVFVVGDGSTPRTATLIACLTKWNCHSIDPNMKNKKWDIQRLTTYKNKMDELEFVGNNSKTSIIVCVHSHAPLKDSFERVKNYGKKYLVNIPCCVKPDMDFAPFKVYNDFGIHSEKREVSIWEQ